MPKEARVSRPHVQQWVRSFVDLRAVRALLSVACLGLFGGVFCGWRSPIVCEAWHCIFAASLLLRWYIGFLYFVFSTSRLQEGWKTVLLVDIGLASVRAATVGLLRALQGAAAGHRSACTAASRLCHDDKDAHGAEVCYSVRCRAFGPARSCYMLTSLSKGMCIKDPRSELSCTRLRQVRCQVTIRPGGTPFSGGTFCEHVLHGYMACVAPVYI